MKRFRWVVTYLVSLGLVLAALTNILWAKNPNVAPRVSIISPQNGAKVYSGLLDVVVSFGPKKHGLGNVRTIKLKLDGNLVAMHDNPAQIKEGSYTFKLDITNLSDGDHTLQAFAYQAEERAMLEGSSEIITFTFSTVVLRQITKLKNACATANKEVAEQIVNELIQMGKPAVPVLLTEFAPEKEPYFLPYVTIILTQIGESGIPALLQGLNDDSPYIRKGAAAVLGHIGDKRAVEPLFALLKDPESGVREATVYALGLIGDKRATGPLTQMLNNSTYPVPADDIIWALGKIKDETAVNVVLARLTDENAVIRARAAIALGEIGAVTAINSLIEALQDEERIVRSSALQALGMIEDEGAILALLGALQSEALRSDAIDALAKVEDDRALEALIELLTADDSYDRYQAVLTLAKKGDKRAVDPLIEALKEDESAGVRAEAARALGVIGDERAIGPLTEALEDPSDFVRLYAAEALEQIRGTE